MYLLHLLCVVLLALPLATAQKCEAANCKAPDCRCWDDPAIPGGLAAADTPQMVLISFEYGVNAANVALYQDLFSPLKNPNGCEPKGTFFVSKLNTDFGTVKTISDAGHQVGMTSSDGRIPQDADQWLATYKEMKAELVGAGVPEDRILGCRGPELYSGGNAQFDAIANIGLLYDSTCVSKVYTSKDNLKWPYTYDFVEGTPACTIGTAPTQAYPGRWQFLVADIEWKGQICASPSACSPLITSAQDAFDMLYSSFAEHYEGGKSPLVLYIDPLWLTVDYQKEGTVQFLEFIRTAYEDTWITTHQQALDWMKDPQASDKAGAFKPWACT